MADFDAILDSTLALEKPMLEPKGVLEHLLVQLLKKIPLAILLLSLQYDVFLRCSSIEVHRIFMSIALNDTQGKVAAIRLMIVCEQPGDHPEYLREGVCTRCTELSGYWANCDQIPSSRVTARVRKAVSRGSQNVRNLSARCLHTLLARSLSASTSSSRIARPSNLCQFFSHILFSALTGRKPGPAVQKP